MFYTKNLYLRLTIVFDVVRPEIVVLEDVENLLSVKAVDALDELTKTGSPSSILRRSVAAGVAVQTFQIGCRHVYVGLLPRLSVAIVLVVVGHGRQGRHHLVAVGVGEPDQKRNRLKRTVK